MPISILHLKKNERTLTLDYQGETLTLTYRPGAITPALYDEINSPLYTRNSLVDILARMLVSWDVLGDDGSAVAPVVDELKQLPTMFLQIVHRAIFDDMAPAKN